MSSFLGGGSAAVTASKLATGNQDFYVATTGSDSNPGTITKPFRTIQHAVNAAALFDWVTAPGSPFAPTIHVANGTYTETVMLQGFDTMPTGTIVGNPTTPANVVVSSSGISFTGTGFATWTIQGFRCTPTDRSFFSENFFSFMIDDITHDVTNIGMSCRLGGSIFIGPLGGTNGQTFNNGGGTHNSLISSVRTGFFGYDGGPVNVTGAINFSFTVFNSGTASVIQFPLTNSANFTGGANVTGPQYSISVGSIYDGLGVGNRSQIAGSTVGTINTGSFIGQDLAYEIFTPTNGGTVTPTPGDHQIILNPASGLTSLTVRLPTNMSDGETTTIASTQSISGLVLTTTDGTTIANVPAALTMGWGSRITLVLDRTNTTWYPAGSVLH